MQWLPRTPLRSREELAVNIPWTTFTLEFIGRNVMKRKFFTQSQQLSILSASELLYCTCTCTVLPSGTVLTVPVALEFKKIKNWHPRLSALSFLALPVNSLVAHPPSSRSRVSAPRSCYIKGVITYFLRPSPISASSSALALPSHVTRLSRGTVC